MKEIIIYTDGGCQNNGKKDCYGSCAYLILINGQHLQEKVISLYETSNNRAEMQAIINSLNYLLDHSLTEHYITLYSDSEYCVKGINEWSKKWKSFNWRKTKNAKDRILNYDLWRELDELVSNFSDIQFNWVKGHEDNEWNNYVNDLCTAKQEVIKNNLV